MDHRVVPMIHVPDVRATIGWYESVGFEVLETFGDGGGNLSFAVLAFGGTQVMFNSGGRVSTVERRDVDLYIYTDDVDGVYARLKDRVDIIEGPHETFYEMREVIVRDPNGFWLTFAQPAVGERLMKAVRDGDIGSVRTMLASTHASPDRLSAALGAAIYIRRDDIADELDNAGAVAPLPIDGEVLERYAGTYTSAEGIGARIIFEAGMLIAIPDEAQTAVLLPVDVNTFRPVGLADAVVHFSVDERNEAVLTFTQGTNTIRMTRASSGTPERA
jgi:uncharacterized glyoxalase superfamily protein PhnB